jgi:hypothetical protein
MEPTEADLAAARDFAEKEFGEGPDAEMHAASYLAGRVDDREWAAQQVELHGDLMYPEVLAERIRRGPQS